MNEKYSKRLKLNILTDIIYCIITFTFFFIITHKYGYIYFISICPTYLLHFFNKIFETNYYI